MYVCLKCGNKNRMFFEEEEVHPGNFKLLCKVPECWDRYEATKIIEIDDMLVDIIPLLNQNGFITGHCCEGHYVGPNGSIDGEFVGDEGYISFHCEDLQVSGDEIVEGIFFGNDHNAYEELFNSIPDTIGDFIITGDFVIGPKDVNDRRLISKRIIRFVLDKDVKIANTLDFEQKKVQLFSLFYIQLLDFFEQKKEKDSLK